MMTCNVVSPQLMWFKKLRTSLTFTFLIAIVVNIGMWFERFVIIGTTLHRDYLPSSWSMFYPTHIDIGIFVGTIGLFFEFFLLFTRYFSVLSLNEIKSILKSSGQSYKDGDAKTPAFSIEEQHLAEVKLSPSSSASTKASAQEVSSPSGADLEALVKGLGAADESQKDDLKELAGLGPAIENKLNEIGIYSFAQRSEERRVG